MSACYGCKNLFTYNPMRVPSIRVNDAREPICRACMEKVNALRKREGRELLNIFSDAYEPCDETELVYH